MYGLTLSILLTLSGIQPAHAQTVESAVTPVRLVPARPSGFYNWAHTGARIGGEFRTNEAALVEQVRIYQNAMNQLQLQTRDLRNTPFGLKKEVPNGVVTRSFGPDGELSAQKQAGIQKNVDTAYAALKKIYIIKGDLTSKLMNSFALERNRLDAQKLKVPGRETSLAQVLSRFSGPALDSAIGLAHYVEKTESTEARREGTSVLMRNKLNKLFAVQAEMQSDLLTRKDGVGERTAGLEASLRGQLKQLASLEKTGVELREPYQPLVSGQDDFHHRYPPARPQFEAYLNEMKQGFREVRNRALATKAVGAPLVIMVGSLGFSVAANAGEAEAVSNTADEVSESPSFESQSWARPSTRNRVSRGVRQ
jgi:hypothetical protein